MSAWRKFFWQNRIARTLGAMLIIIGIGGLII